jgi:predicted nucleotidyltransferase
MDSELATWLANLEEWAANKASISEVWIFGSRARGTHQGDSDLDVAVSVLGARDIRFNIWFWQFPKWRGELQALLPVAIDLRLLDSEIPENDKVLPAVRKEGIQVFQRQQRVA